MKHFVINYFQDEDGVFTAVVPAIRGCVASGKSLEEAYKNACDAIESCIEARQKISNQNLEPDSYENFNRYELNYA